MCKHKTKTQIRAYLSEPLFVDNAQINSNKRAILVEKLTNEIHTYLFFKHCLAKKNILQTSLMTYLGAFACDDTTYIHMTQVGYGNANIALSKMKVSDTFFIKELLTQVLGVLYACDNACHGNLSLTNIQVFPKSFKLCNFSNGVVNINPRGKSRIFVTNHLGFTDLRFKSTKHFVQLTSDPGIYYEKDALQLISILFIRGLKTIDVYTLLISIALHKRFSHLFLSLHNNKNTLEYILQSIWSPRQRPFINLKISQNIGKNSILDCVKFLTSPLSNGEFILLNSNLREKLLSQLLE